MDSQTKNLSHRLCAFCKGDGDKKSTANCLCPGREAPVEERYPRVLTVETSLKVQFSWSTITAFGSSCCPEYQCRCKRAHVDNVPQCRIMIYASQRAYMFDEKLSEEVSRRSF